MTTIPTITALPTPVPQTSDPDNFDARADTFLAALPAFVTQANASIGAINTVAGEIGGNAAAAAGSATAAAGSATAAAGSVTAAQTAAALATGALTYVATSASSLSIGTGAKAFALNEAGRSFANGDAVVAERRSDPSARMYGTVSSYAANTLTINVTSVVGAGGPFTDWLIFEQAFDPLPAASAADVRAGATTGKSMTPGSEYSALAEVALADAATIAVDMGALINAAVTFNVAGATRVLGNPTNPKVGQTGFIRLIQDGSGSRALSFGSNWKRPGGAPTLTATPNAVDVLEYQVLSATYILYNILLNPS